MAKSAPKTTAFFIFHVTNFSSVFHSKHASGAIESVRKQNVLSKPVFRKYTPEIVDSLKFSMSSETPKAPVGQSSTVLQPPMAGHRGFQNHSILTLSDEELGSIPVSVLMSRYGEAEGGNSCPADFGNELVNRWRKLKTRTCGSGDEELSRIKEVKPSALGSSIDCHLIHQTRHHGAGDQLCVMHNVMVNLALFNDEELTTKVVKEYVSTMHAKQPYVKFPQDFIQGDCKPSADSWKSVFQPGWNADFTVGGYTHSEKISADECDMWVESPVLATNRDTFANFFHDSEDFFNVFLAMAVLEWSKGDTQMFLTDLYPEGPFWPMWSKVFSSSSGALPAMTAWDIKNKFKSVGKAASGSKVNKVCFRSLAVGIYGPAAPITVASWDTPCKKTALVRAYSDYVIRGLGLQHLTHYANPAPLKTVTVTYMARRPSKEWPEKKYCDTLGSFFDCSLWENFGQRNLGRMVRNDAEVVAALKALETEEFEGKVVKVQDVDYNILSFEEQIKIDLATDIMVGAHGAGLMHNIFMRDRAALVELFVDGSSVNRHFHNLAFWYGRRYTGNPIQNPVNIEELKGIIRREIEEIDVDQY